MPFEFAPADAPARPLHLVTAAELEAWCARQPAAVRAWVEETAFTARPGELRLLPGESGLAGAVFGIDEGPSARVRFRVAEAASAVPAGDWRIEGDLDAEAATEAALGWLLAGYRYARYAGEAPEARRLVPPPGIDAARIEAISAGEALTRDLINTPARDMGPADLAEAAVALAARFGAACDVIEGAALAKANLPLIETVGAAAAAGRGPRLIDLRHGDSGPRLTLVGKGVCFDTGGLNLKPGSSMALMKKDMGGAATVLGLAEMILALGVQVRLRVLIPAVENAVSGAAFRPGDILTARNGKTVEINNTDAEGRLVLADALALADEEAPDLLVSMATLTGAARVAVGPDIAPFFTHDEGVTAALRAAGARVSDPVWPLPLHAPYEAWIEPGIADLDNAPSGGFAGATTAALFLHRFVASAPRYVHFDIYGWQPTAAPARPKGGVGQGARALLEALPDILGPGTR